MKWISSFPGNIDAGIPRASAVLILNDHRHRLPVRLSGGLDHQRHPDGGVRRAGRRPAQPGSGPPDPGRVLRHRLIARYIHTFLTATGWSFDEIGVHDLSAESADGFRGYLERSGTAGRITVHDSAEQLIRSSDLVVFATVAGTAARHDPSLFDHNPLVLHVSLRDLAPEILLAATNIVDDVEHCLKADTSPHLAEQLTGNREFVHGTLADVMTGRVTFPPTGRWCSRRSASGSSTSPSAGTSTTRWSARATLHVVEDFFHEMRRFG